MSFLAKNPQMPAANADSAQQISTYRESDPVPLGYGRDYFASRWISKKYDEHSAFGGQNKPEWQYCSIAAMYCAGPIDFVGKVKINGEVHVFDHNFADGEESHEFTMNAALESGRAWTFVVHRGAEDAPVPTVLNAATGQTHPPYRGRCWIEWRNIDLGQGSTALPDIQVELGRRAPSIGDWEAAPEVGNYGVNPFAAIHALLTDEAGYGLSADYFDAAHWGTQALALEATGVADRSGMLTHCHPVFKSAQEAGSLLSTILAHVDGFIYVESGQFRIGWFPSQPPPDDLPEITEHDLDGDAPQAEFPDWNRAPGSAVVVYRDYERQYNETPALHPAPANRETGVVAAPARAERPMIHVAEQATRIAAEISAARGTSEATVMLKVLKSRAVRAEDGSAVGVGDTAVPLMPGDLFRWDYGPHSLDLVMRVTGRRIRAGEPSDIIEAIPERGQFPLPYVAPVDARVLPTNEAPGVVAEADVRLWLLPSGFTRLRAIAPLVNRAHRGIYRADLHLSTTGGDPWAMILDSRFFAAKCAVTNGGISSGATTVRVTSTSVDFARMAAQDDVAQADDALCLLVGDEVCSVGAITPVATNTYDLAILRGRRGTTAAAQADGAVTFLFKRSELMSVEHAEFYRVRDGSNVYNGTIATKYFQFQLYTVSEVGALAPAAPGIDVQLPDLSADETQGYTIVITNEAHTVACDASGNVNAGQLGSGSNAQTDVKVYRGGTALTPVNSAPNSDQFSIALGTLTATTATKVDADTVRADTLSSDSGTIEILISVAGAFTIPKLFSLTKSKAGATGAPGASGAAGAQGIPGPGLVYAGVYSSAAIYYHTTSRRDVVRHGSDYYLVNNQTLSGGVGSTWGTPGGGNVNWTGPDSTYKFVATDLLLANDATILRTLVMGDGVTAGAGLIRSHGAAGFGSGTGFWMGMEGTTPKLRVGNPSAAYMSWDGATLQVNSPRITGDGLYISSPIGMRYISDNSVLTITGGSNNGAGYGAQIDLCGAQEGTGGALVLAAANNLSNPTGSIRFRTASAERGVVAYDGTLRWNLPIWVGGNPVLGARKSAVTAAPMDAPNDADEDITNLSGGSTVHYANLVSHLNAVDARLNLLADKINEIGARVNDIRDRLRASSGHGLIDD